MKPRQSGEKIEQLAYGDGHHGSVTPSTSTSLRWTSQPREASDTSGTKGQPDEAIYPVKDRLYKHVDASRPAATTSVGSRSAFDGNTFDRCCGTS